MAVAREPVAVVPSSELGVSFAAAAAAALAFFCFPGRDGEVVGEEKSAEVGRFATRLGDGYIRTGTCYGSPVSSM